MNTVDRRFWEGLRNAVIPSLILWALILWGVSALFSDANATKPTPVPPSDPVATAQAVSGAAAGAQSDAVSKSLSGAESASQAASDASNSQANRETHIGVALAGVNVVQISECFVPKGKMGRGFRALFGAWEMTPVMVLDQICVAEKRRDADNEHEYRMALLALEADRLRLESLKLENCVECAAQK